MGRSPRDVGAGFSLAGDWLGFGGDREARNGKLVAQSSSTGGPPYPRIQYPRFQLFAVYRGPKKKKLEN